MERGGGFGRRRSLQGDTVRSARTTPEREIVIELSGGSFLIEPTADRR